MPTVHRLRQLPGGVAHLDEGVERQRRRRRWAAVIRDDNPVDAVVSASSPSSAVKGHPLTRIGKRMGSQPVEVSHVRPIFGNVAESSRQRSACHVRRLRKGEGKTGR